MSANFLIQGLLIVLAAILVMTPFVPTDDKEHYNIATNVHIVIPIPALALQSGATIASSRLLGFGGEIPVTVLTSTYAALATDPKLLKWKNTPRNRRVAAVVCLFAGAICSAWIMKKGAGIKACLWLGAGMKIVLAGAVLLFMPSQKSASDTA